MKIDDLKKEIQRVRVPEMDTTFRSGKKCTPAEFFDRIRQQDRKDEKFMLYKRIIPVSIGLIGFAVVVIIAPIRTPVMFAGSLLMFLGMLLGLILFFLDYRDISKETFNASVAEFLKDKQKRFSYWRSTPLKHHFVLALFLIGWLMINFGNKPFMRDHGKFPFAIFTGLLLFIIILLNINSERLYRKRHKSEHQPLLKMIEEIEEGLEEGK